LSFPDGSTPAAAIYQHEVVELSGSSSTRSQRAANGTVVLRFHRLRDCHAPAAGGRGVVDEAAVVGEQRQEPVAGALARHLRRCRGHRWKVQADPVAFFVDEDVATIAVLDG